MATELSFELILAIVVWFSAWVALMVQAVLTRLEIKRIMETAKPLMAKAEVALENAEMLPATMVAGIEKVMREQLETQGSPLRLYTRAAIDEGVSAFGAMFDGQLGAVKRLLPAASTILSKAGVEGKADKAEGRASVEALLEQFGPARKLVEKFVPMSKREDPAEFLAYLGKMKQTISAFSPQLGAQLDSMLEQIIMGGMTDVPTEGIAGIVPGNLVRMLPAGAPKASSTSDYMRE